MCSLGLNFIQVGHYKKGLNEYKLNKLNISLTGNRFMFASLSRDCNNSDKLDN